MTPNSRIRVSREDFRVVVRPRRPGDYGFAFIGGQERSERDAEATCENIADQIRRHVDELPSRGSRGVDIEWDTKKACAACGHDWTEVSETFNGGCCDEDMKHEPATEANQ